MPRKPPAPPTRARRSKTEVDEEFAAIREDAKAAGEAADPKREEAARQREVETRASVDGVTVEIVVQRISGLGLEVSKSLAEISGKLAEEVNLLASVREAVELERKELERLHKIDVAATALDQMVQDYARQKQQLETEIAEAREQWEEESGRAERERKEQDEAQRKQRQREIEDYEYKKQLERKKAQDKYDEEVRLTEKKTPSARRRWKKAGSSARPRSRSAKTS